MHAKITPEHLGRGAVVYVRQSTIGQVTEHTESQRRQYALAETARSLVNSTLISTMAALLALLLGTPAAYAIARFRFRRWRNREKRQRSRRCCALYDWLHPIDGQ